jgi:hypothetical protein
VIFRQRPKELTRVMMEIEILIRQRRLFREGAGTAEFLEGRGFSCAHPELYQYRLA